LDANAGGDFCANDVRLEWGDIVDIPERDHPINEVWQGLIGPDRDAIQKCLERKIEIRVKGQSTNIVLRPFEKSTRDLNAPSGRLRPAGSAIGSMVKFRLNRFVRDSGLLRASSTSPA